MKTTSDKFGMSNAININIARYVEAYNTTITDRSTAYNGNERLKSPEKNQRLSFD